MTGAPVLAIGKWPTNADMIVDVARLGYLDGRVLDATWGLGNFWTRWTPEELVAHDLYTLDGVDFRDLPHADGTFNAVVLDGPYKLNGTSSAPDERYGVHERATRDERHELIMDGMTECARCVAPGGTLLVKCQDQVEGGHVRWQTIMFTTHAEIELGLRLEDSFLFPGGRAQPLGRQQAHARRNYSTLLVFRKPKPRRQK